MHVAAASVPAPAEVRDCRRRLAIVLAVVVALLVLNACGSGGPSGDSPVIGGTGTSTGPATGTGTSGTGGTTGGNLATQPGSMSTWILVGGAAKPAYSDVFLDSELNPGELFVITQNALAVNATYQVAISAVAGGETFSHAWTFTTGGMSLSAPDPISAMNGLRSECGVAALSAFGALVTSSTKHAGYQALEDNGITHGETDAGNALYVADNFWQRIEAANGGAFLGNVEAEDIGSLYGDEAIDQLWDTVYHRVPMMRATTNQAGYGDCNTAAAAYPAAHVPTTTAWSYATLDFAGDTSLPILASHWPADGAADAPNAFDDSEEFPHPIGWGSSNGTGATQYGLIGVPIHIIVPSSADFSTIAVSITKQ